MTRDAPKWTRRRYLLASGLAVGVAGCGGETGNGNGNGDGAEENGNGNGDDDVEQTASGVVGELITGDNMEMVVRSVETTPEIGEFQEPDSGNEFQVLRMAIKNTGEDFADFSTHLQATLEDDENYAYDASFAATNKTMQAGLLASGEVARGDVVFEVPEDAEGLKLVMDLGSFDLFTYSRVEVDLTQEADDIADVEQILNVDVHGLGDTVEHEDVAVTVHGVRTEDDLGQYSEPEEGHEFVIPNIEINNDGDGELRVSTLLQMPMKTSDGFTYSLSMHSGQLDQQFSEQQPIQPGQSRRGELAYEVEVDSESRLWTYNFLDFSTQMKTFWSLD